eukprot:1190335-Prorocentrum_minimum.AAC.2
MKCAHLAIGASTRVYAVRLNWPHWPSPGELLALVLVQPPRLLQLPLLIQKVRLPVFTPRALSSVIRINTCYTGREFLPVLREDG